ncbi:MAG: tRNA (adenosine(37)-N6)-dimethylallyltransferase MiaA [Fidelibacterota bacterium]
MSNRPILTVVGPTASGKTSLAVALARRVDGEIIGLDSRQIYRGMAIGTAQPTPEERGGIPHHLIGFRDPREPVSAGEFAKRVRQAVGEIRKRQRAPLICGGAGLYYRAVTRGIFAGSVADLTIRARLDREFDQQGGEALLKRLTSIDPDYAAITHPNNRKRLVRALEIAEATGKPPSEHFRDQKKQGAATLDCFTVFLDWPLDQLEDRIRQRTNQMLQAGWIEEARRLFDQYGQQAIHPLDSIGYRQIRDYLEDKLSDTELVEEIVLRTRQYAKRQRQWFRHEKVDLKINPAEFESAEAMADEILSRYFQGVHSAVE